MADEQIRTDSEARSCLHRLSKPTVHKDCPHRQVAAGPLARRHLVGEKIWDWCSSMAEYAPSSKVGEKLANASAICFRASLFRNTRTESSSLMDVPIRIKSSASRSPPANLMSGKTERMKIFISVWTSSELNREFSIFISSIRRAWRVCARNDSHACVVRRHCKPF